MSQVNNRETVNRGAQKRQPAKPSIVDQLKSGAIALGKQEAILAAIKKDAELSALTDQNGISVWANVENIADITHLPEGSFIAVQKFSIFDPNNKENSKNVINWSPTNYKDMLEIYGIVEGNKDVTISSVDTVVPFEQLPSFLGKNIKKAFEKCDNPEYEVKNFIDSYVKDEKFALSNNIYYRLFIDYGRGNGIKIAVMKAARDLSLSPKKIKTEEK